MKKKSTIRKLWSEEAVQDHLVEAFTIGSDRELDLVLAPYDILGSLAHGTMLHAVDILNSREWHALRMELISLYRKASSNKIHIEEQVEDIHSQIELMLTEKLGEAAKKLHTGRSRNDQVLLDIRLYTRDEIRATVGQVSTLFDTLLSLGEQFQDILLPGYTHMQVAMPSSFGLWLAAFAESLVDDLILIQAAYRIINKNPLGAAAGYGSSFPIDRSLTTRLLGFADMDYNSVYAQMGRGRTERIVMQSMASVAETLNRLATDLVFYVSQNYNFISFPDPVTTGSSIMPHKKNPDVFELLRARTNKMKAASHTVNSILSNLPSGYHRDFQEIKGIYLNTFTELHNCLSIMNHVLPHMKVRDDILKDNIYKHIFTVEMVNEGVKNGKTFRDAYHDVAKKVKNGAVRKPAGVMYTHEGSIGNLCYDKIREKMKAVIGDFNFKATDEAMANLVSENTSAG